MIHGIHFLQNNTHKDTCFDNHANNLRVSHEPQ